MVGDVGESGELEREGAALVLVLGRDEEPVGGESDGSVARRRRKGMRRVGRR